MERYWRVSGRRDDMCSAQMTVLCVKWVKQEHMLLPGDIIEGFAEDDMDEFVPTKARSEFNSQLSKISQQAETLWPQVRIVPLKGSMLQRKFTIQATTDDRHVVVLGDLNLEQYVDFPSDDAQMSRRVVNMDAAGFEKKGMRYDWKANVETYLPNQRSSVVSSVLFMLLPGEHTIEAITTWSMAWFCASVSSGIPLVFVNIQTEQIVTSVSIELVPEPGETRFGMDIKRTEEGFICIFSVTKGSAADCAGLGRIHEEANAAGHLLVVSRLEGKSQQKNSPSAKT
ncbi:hypothetical protein EUGRSUZ_C00704 [Eucalyptus grandis]|uniref:Uncharacterized protein n=2 Tax=Eucalyptus grandis TaxID=71139 RepID=A0ACC3LBV8_EUCGR|nr:hypothetical protein EUGRSUZ_C00704 [Eucalyptus grandis]